jgi:hypothetical protein
MGTVRVRILILTVRITLSVCLFNRMAYTANNRHIYGLINRGRDIGTVIPTEAVYI